MGYSSKAVTLAVLVATFSLGCGSSKKSDDKSSGSSNGSGGVTDIAQPSDKIVGSSEEQATCLDRLSALEGKWEFIQFDFNKWTDLKGKELGDAEKKKWNLYRYIKYPELTIEFDRENRNLHYTRPLYSDREEKRTVRMDFRGYANGECLLEENSKSQKEPDMAGSVLIGLKLPETIDKAENITGSCRWTGSNTISLGTVNLVK